MTIMAHERRPALTLLELLVVLAIIGVLIMLLLPAVQKVREAANRLKCSNNLWRTAVATHNFHDTYNQLPPAIGSVGGGSGTWFFHLLPFIEQDPLYQSSRVGGTYTVAAPGVYDRPIQVWLCPSDPSVGPGGTVTDDTGTAWGACSYAANNWIALCVINASGSNYNIDYNGVARWESVTDGLSQTVLYGEKYATCTNAANPIGGCSWSYYRTDAAAWPLWAGLGPVINSQSMFQVQPRQGNCIAWAIGGLGSTSHPSGMMVCMCDGSVHLLAAGLDPTIWWHLNTPRGGEPIPGDW
jgi:prepilin-type N-terminal cleavage/methylation domain-containing protein